MTGILENAGIGGTFIGRVWDPAAKGPSVVTLRDGNLIDITSKAGPTTRDICEMDDPVGYIRTVEGRTLGTLDDIAAGPVDPGHVHLLAPCDLQAVKACERNSDTTRNSQKWAIREWVSIIAILLKIPP